MSPEPTALAPVEVVQVTEEGDVLLSQVDDLTIYDQESANAGGLVLASIKAYKKRVQQVMDPIVQATHKAWKVAVAQRDGLLEPAVQAEQTVKQRLTAWEQAEEARRKQVQEAMQREARQEAARQHATQARILEEQGQTAAAEAVRQAPAPVVFTPPPPPAPRVQGVGFRDQWSAHVTDLRKLVEAVARGDQALDLLQPNQTALNKLAVALKDHLNVPGVEAKKERIAASK